MVADGGYWLLADASYVPQIKRIFYRYILGQKGKRSLLIFLLLWWPTAKAKSIVFHTKQKLFSLKLTFLDWLLVEFEYESSHVHYLKQNSVRVGRQCYSLLDKELFDSYISFIHVEVSTGRAFLFLDYIYNVNKNISMKLMKCCCRKLKNISDSATEWWLLGVNSITKDAIVHCAMQLWGSFFNI